MNPATVDGQRLLPAPKGVNQSVLGSVTLAGRNREISGFAFGLYIYFLVDFFLHFSARVPAYGLIRPTLLLVFIISMSLYVQAGKLKGLGSDPLIKAMNALLIYLLISLPLVEWPGSVIKNNLSEFVKAIVFLYFTAFIVDSRKRFVVFLFVFIFCQLVRVLEPLFMNLTSGYWGSKTYLGGGEFANRLSGAPSDVINPNELGFVIVTLIPFLHYFLWQDRFYKKVVYLLLMPAIMYALILTMSRGAMIALVVIGWMLFKSSNRKFFMIVSFLIAVILGWSVMNETQKDRYRSLFDSEAQGSATVEGRWAGMQREFELGFKKPIFGHGLGTTPEAKKHIMGGRDQAAHNLYAELLIEIGIVGAFFFLSMIVHAYKKFVSVKHVVSSGVDVPIFYQRMMLAMTAVFWMYVVYSMNYWGLSVYYWYLFGGMSFAFYRIMQKEGLVGSASVK